MLSHQQASAKLGSHILGPIFFISAGYCKKDVTPLLTHWSYAFLALTHQYVVYVSSGFIGLTMIETQYDVF